jgi:hypothetical protein
MKRFILAAAVAVALGLGLANTAHAQYVIGYNGPTPNGGVVSTGSIYNLGGVQTYRTYISPYGTVKQQVYATNAFGTTIGAARAYNPYTGLGYNTGYYNPSTYLYPYGGIGYGYNFYRRW